ncbi:MAG TPA: Maf family protein, partial [Acidimicrobiia bacterium]|nr:Maf family protein [Acidimicrobiia bacterium]
MRMVLASGSPRRAALLNQLGLEFDVDPPDVDEGRLPDERPDAYVERLAREKALTANAPETLVVAADTAVVHEGHLMGKPGHPEEARSMLRRLAGQVHDVVTGLAVAVDDDVHSLV